MTTAEGIVQDNRNATKADAQTLATIYGRLYHGEKRMKKAVREAGDAWLGTAESRQDARDARDEAVAKYDTIMDESWAALQALPNGTTAGNGATPQTVGLQFFNRNLNRNLKGRITASDARKINAASFVIS